MYSRIQDKYTVNCQIDTVYGFPSEQDPNKTVESIGGMLSYSLEDCIDACSAYRYYANRNYDARTCLGVSFRSSLNSQVAISPYNNCWLKNGTVASTYWHFDDENTISAQLSTT